MVCGFPHVTQLPTIASATRAVAAAARPTAALSARATHFTFMRLSLSNHFGEACEVPLAPSPIRMCIPM